MPRKIGSHDSKFTELRPQKPYKLRRWKTETPTGYAHFFTCARPGRSSDSASKDRTVPDELVHRWIKGLRGERLDNRLPVGTKTWTGGSQRVQVLFFLRRVRYTRGTETGARHCKSG